MRMPGFARLPGSERAELPGLQRLGAVAPDERVDLTVVLSRRAELPAAVTSGDRMLSRDQLAFGYGADPGAAERVRAVLTSAGWQVTATDLGSRRLEIAGPARLVPMTFGTNLERVREPEQGTEHRYRTGDLWLPSELDGRVLAVLGLDTRPQARTPLRVYADPSQAQSYTPLQLGSIYRFPASADGSGQTVAIIELGGGYRQPDLDSYFQGLGVPVPQVSAVGVDGAANTPGQSSADTEVTLDIEVVGALAPGAVQKVYFAPNTNKGFLDALSQATHAQPTPAAISISWGQSEDQWPAQARTAMDHAIADVAALGITVCTAAGDGGAATTSPMAARTPTSPPQAHTPSAAEAPTWTPMPAQAR